MKKINKRGMTSFLAVIMTIACITNPAISASAYDSAIAAAGGAAIAAIESASDKGSSGNHHGGGGRSDKNDEFVYDGTIASGDYTKTHYVVPKNDGMLWAKDTFSFTVSEDGTVELKRVKQKTSKFPITNFEPNHYKVVDHAEKWIKVETYWKSNKEISISVPAMVNGKEFDVDLKIPALKDVTCVYKIYADGTLEFIEKYW